VQKIREDNMRGLKDMRVFKVVIVYLLITFSLFTMLWAPLAEAQEENGVVKLVVDENASDKVAQKGKLFTVAVKLINNSGKELSNISLSTLQQESLSPIGYGWEIVADGTLASPGERKFTLQFVYNGTNNFVSLGFICDYKIEGVSDNATTSWNVYVETQSDRSDNTVPDTTKYKPSINIKSDIPMPAF